MKWRVIGFNHPENQHSLVYEQNLTTQQLLDAIIKGERKGCNLFSVRGFKE